MKLKFWNFRVIVDDSAAEDSAEEASASKAFADERRKYPPGEIPFEDAKKLHKYTPSEIDESERYSESWWFYSSLTVFSAHRKRRKWYKYNFANTGPKYHKTQRVLAIGKQKRLGYRDAVITNIKRYDLFLFVL